MAMANEWKILRGKRLPRELVTHSQPSLSNERLAMISLFYAVISTCMDLHYLYMCVNRAVFKITPYSIFM